VAGNDAAPNDDANVEGVDGPEPDGPEPDGPEPDGLEPNGLESGALESGGVESGCLESGPLESGPLDFDREDGPANPLRIPDERALDELLRYFATKDSPRIFALCAVAKGWRRAEVAAWGMSFADQAVLYLPGERSIGFFSSAQHAADLFGMGRDVRLVWPDFVPLREMITS
jgi:hypothetical protein